MKTLFKLLKIDKRSPYVVVEAAIICYCWVRRGYSLVRRPLSYVSSMKYFQFYF